MYDGHRRPSREVRMKYRLGVTYDECAPEMSHASKRQLNNSGVSSNRRKPPPTDPESRDGHSTVLFVCFAYNLLHHFSSHHASASIRIHIIHLQFEIARTESDY